MIFNYYYLEYSNSLFISFCFYSFQFFYLTIQLNCDNLQVFVIH